MTGGLHWKCPPGRARRLFITKSAENGEEHDETGDAVRGAPENGSGTLDAPLNSAE